MIAVARALSRALLSVSHEVDIPRQLLLFAAAGLLIAVLMATYGLDLSPGLF